MPEPAESNAQSTVARSTRGVAFIALAKVWFMLTGFAQPIFLTRILGQSGYGVYASVLNAVSILNNVVVAGSIQAMSHAVTLWGARALRRGLVLHVAMGTLLASAFAALAGPLGVRLLHDPQLPPLLRVAAIVVGDYTVYAALVGVLNGQQRFRAQATLDMTFAALRTALVIGLATTSWQAAGSVLGFALASAVITIVALVAVWPSLRHANDLVATLEPADLTAATGAKSSYRPRPLGGSTESVGAFARKYLGFFAPVLLYQFALNMVLQADLLVLKALLVRRPNVSLTDANTLVGIYKSVQNFAFLPYQLLLAVTFVVFPVVSRATLEGDRGTTERFVRGALRFSTLALGAMLAALTAVPAGVLRLAYKPDVLIGTDALRLLSVGQGLFALANIATTIIVASGRTLAATMLVIVMLSAVFVGDYAGLQWAPTAAATLTYAAAGTAGGILVGLIFIGVYTVRTFGAFVPVPTLIRTVFACAAAAVVTAHVPLHGKLVTLVLAATAVGIYVVAMLVMRELEPAERTAVVATLRRGLGGRTK